MIMISLFMYTTAPWWAVLTDVVIAAFISYKSKKH